MSQSVADKAEWRGSSEGAELKETGTVHWSSPNTGATNSSKFTALPGGYRGSGYFNGIGIYGIFWTATESEYDATYAWRRTLSNSNTDIYRYYFPKITGLSIRCLRNN